MFSRDQQHINNLMHSRQEDFLCTDEWAADACIGVEIKASEEGMTLRQPQIIRCIIALLHLIDAKPKPTLVAKTLFIKNVNGKER